MLQASVGPEEADACICVLLLLLLLLLLRGGGGGGGDALQTCGRLMLCILNDAPNEV